jgi:ribosomal-protein-alanine N-acetyltransferase
LLNQHAARLAASGMTTLYLEVEEDNRPARALYERMGFDTLGKRPGYYKKRDGSAANALVMRCRLDRL